MRVLVRADASSHIGHGHVARCIALAHALSAKGAEVRFASYSLPAPLRKRVESAGFRLLALSDVGSQSEDEDFEATYDAIQASAYAPHWVVVDHYRLSSQWETGWRVRGVRVLAVDDLADRSHECDVLLDQNLVAGMENRYHGLVPGEADCLLGPQYALLAPEYAQLARQARPRMCPPRRLVISFGGGDAQALAKRAIEAALDVPGAEFDVDLVGQYGLELTELVRRLDANSRVRLLGVVPSLGSVSLSADLALGAAGSSIWERLCVGLPMLVVTTAPNQLPVAEELNRRGLLTWLGNDTTLSVETIRTALHRAVVTTVDTSWWHEARNLVDGQGAQRVAAALISRR